jgi:hypothetical protein
MIATPVARTTGSPHLTESLICQLRPVTFASCTRFQISLFATLLSGMLLLSNSASAGIANNTHAENKQPLNSTAGTSIDLGFDTNVSVDEIDLVTSKGDRFVKIGIAADAEYAIYPASELHASYQLSDQRFDDFNELNRRTHMLSTGAVHKFSNVKAELSYRYTDASLGGDDFAQTSQWAPVISGFINKQQFVRLVYSNGHKWFADNPQRDNSYFELGADYYYFLNGIRQYVSATIKVGHENADEPEFEYQLQQLHLRYQYRTTLLAYPVKLKLGWRYQHRDYDEIPNTIVNDFRIDRRRHYAIGLEFQLQQKLTADLQAEYQDNESNLQSVAYDKRVFSIGVQYQLW